MKIKMFGVICLSILVIVLTSLLMAQALTEETNQLVDEIRWKHYPFTVMADITVDYFDYYSWNMTFDNEKGILYIETNEGKWFVEMEKVDG